MFTCLWQLWDWLDPPPLFTTATMESKKLQQMQQANSHLAPQTLPQTKAPSFHPSTGDYRPPHSPVFQNHPQYQSIQSNFAQINLTSHRHGEPQQPQQHQHYQQQATPQQQPAGNSIGNHMMAKPLQNSHNHTPNFQQSQQIIQQPHKQSQQPLTQTTSASHLGHYHGEQIYQTSNRERLYQQAPPRSHFPPTHSHMHSSSQLQQQYQQLQQAKLQQQIKTQNEALIQQQRTFALRQQLNPPIPQSHYHMSASQTASSSTLHIPSSSSSSQTQRNNVPPSSLNLTNQFQPADGPIVGLNNQHNNDHYGTNITQQHTLLQSQKAQSQAIYQQNQQIQHQLLQHRQQQHQSSAQQDNQNQIIIHQNHPNLVVNQACQTQISGTVHKIKSPSENSNSSLQTPSSSASHPPLEKKKSGGQIHTLKSPITKRPATSPITLSGWLYKQGSEGLKVWRKRWFVLSEYCLYYYKGSEEEKLLGSILLPSYRVAACSAEDKIYKKFAFKCEHANMRTYWLAAETADMMGQWVRSLTAATMMQGSSESDQISQPSVSSLNHSGENSDSGIHTYQSQQSKMSVHGPLTPASDSGGGPQPLYANAPPKPRRANDGGYSSPSPENSIERYDSNYDSFRHHDTSGQHGRRLDVKSPLIHHNDPVYESRQVNSKHIVKMNDPSILRMQQLRLDNNKSPNQPRAQVRSPFPPDGQYPITSYNPESSEDIYQTNRENIIRAPQRFNDDYQGQQIYGDANDKEIYMQRLIQQKQLLQLQQQKYSSQGGGNNLNQIYPNAERRTPDTYGRSRSGNQQPQSQYHILHQQQVQGRNFSDYEDIYNLGQITNQNQVGSSVDLGAYRRPVSPVGYDNSSRHVPNMPLRYTHNYLEPNTTQHIQMRARPAQTTVVPRPHSADFLEYEARNPENIHFTTEPPRAPRPKSSLDINRTPDSFYYSEASYAEKMRQSALYLQKQPHGRKSEQGTNNYNLTPTQSMMTSEVEIASPQITESNTIPRESDYDRALRLGLTDLPQNQVASVPRVNKLNSKSYPYQTDQFLRSASARLPRKDDDNTNGRDGERKREESMKRLLEWKQRMLQSPLTRKGAPLSIPPPTVTVKSPVIEKAMPHGLQRSRSETNANAGYNSYSSDDEASISVRNVRNIPKSNLTVKPEPSDSININLKNEINNTMTSYYQNRNNNEVIENNNKFMRQEILNSNNNNNNIINNSMDNTIEHQRNLEIYGMRNSNSGNIRQAGLNNYRNQQSNQWIMRSESQRDLDIIENEREVIRNLDVSAGDLLSRTHEELVLLLIQLRRQNSATARAIEQCCTDIHDIQNRIRKTEGPARMENISKLDTVKQHLVDLEKQYEKSKPLVNLVDNMVKLGSLYRGGPELMNRPGQPESVTLDRLEFNQRIQERRLLQEERKHWDRLSPNHLELKTKVQQLYQLDQLLQQESGTLQSLQRDKEDIERALGGLRARLQNGHDPPIALEAARKQQHALERELSRVHHLLAENSKKLEQTVAGNARLEQELLVLRQKLQASRTRGSQSGLSSGSQTGAPDSIPYTGGTTAVLESELRRVQQLVGDMQRQRQELSQAVRQLTENSNTLYQQIKPNEYSSHIKKRPSTTGWTETDLDSMSATKHASSNSLSSETALNLSNGNLNSSTTPLYIDTGSANSSVSILNYSTSSRISAENDLHKKYGNHRHQESDGIESSGMESENDLLEDSTFSNLSNQEKQEIKTVRIVKRESQQRQRDRERNGSSSFSSQNLDNVIEEQQQLQQQADDYNNYNRSKSLPRTYIDHEIYQPDVRAHENNIYSGSHPAIPMKYSDYYSNLVNHYPVSMTDRHQAIMQEPDQPKYSSVNKVNRPIAYQDYSVSGGLKNKTESVQSLTKVVGDLSPVFQSEAAKQIIIEMSGNTSEENGEKVPIANKQRRAVPKEKRRHYTAPHHLTAKSMQSIQAENDMNRNITNWRARDDLDMEVALRPRINAPDVVRSAIGPREKISENTIDKLLAAPSKILIPERYIPEQAPELSPEEKKRRQEKVEAIKKMLSEAPINTSNDSSSLPPTQISADKKQREHLLQLNQLLAQQVMQMSKMVAEKAMAALPSKVVEMNSLSEEDHSPVTPLPIYQQRENYFS